MSSSPHLMGNNAKQRAHPPITFNFETVDPVHNPGATQTAATFNVRYQGTQVTINGKQVSLSTLTTPYFDTYGEANFADFQTQISKPIDAVAFIGHSLQNPNGGGAVGLCFGQIDFNQVMNIPIYPCYSTLPGLDNEGFVYNGAEYTVLGSLASIGPSQAKIIFVAACDLDASMQNFMGISNSTVGRALLFPQSVTDIDLDQGEFEWRQILANMASGQNLQVALDNANKATANQPPWYQWDSTTNTNVLVPPQTWQVIGDSGNGGAGIHF